MSTCAERVQGSFNSTMDDIRTLWDAYCSGEDEVEDLGSIYDYGLCFDYVEGEDGENGFFRYQLSTGGPADEFRFYTGYDHRVYHIEYWFLDWFDGAHIELKGDDKELLTEIYNWFDECGSTTHAYEQAMF